MIKAIFLDFYGTVVHEDDAYIDMLCKRIASTASVPAVPSEIGRFWWKRFCVKCAEAYGERFQTQRALEIEALRETLASAQSPEHPDELAGMLFEHWMKPGLFEDSKPFFRQTKLPVYILSNIDRSDLIAAIRSCGLELEGDRLITSEDVRSYKPRQEMFAEALRRSGLRPHEALHVGDSLANDVGGARMAGIPVVWINRKQKSLPPEYRPDRVISRLTELLEPQ